MGAIRPTDHHIGLGMGSRAGTREWSGGSQAWSDLASGCNLEVQVLQSCFNHLYIVKCGVDRTF